MKQREKIIAGVLFLLLTLFIPAAGYADVTYVIDPSAGTGGNGALFRVDPVSGARTVLSDFGAGPNQGVGPYDIAVFQQKAIPTMTEWGIIFFVLLAGLGSLYNLKRKRRVVN